MAYLTPCAIGTGALPHLGIKPWQAPLLSAAVNLPIWPVAIFIFSDSRGLFMGKKA